MVLLQWTDCSGVAMGRLQCWFYNTPIVMVLYWTDGNCGINSGPNGMILYRCPRRNVPDFGRVFLMLKYTDITQNTYVQSWTVTEIMAREMCGLLAGPRTVPVSWQSYPFPSLNVVSYDGNSAQASHWTEHVFPSGWYVVQVTAALWMVGKLVVRNC